MIILFVAKSKKDNISTIITDQAESLEKEGVTIKLFKVAGSGIKSLIATPKKLRDYVKIHNIDIIHAHYGLTGFLAIMAFTGKPVVVSYMGSDLMGERTIKGKISFKSRLVIILSWISQFFANKLIVKSEKLRNKLILGSKTVVIPNGVDLQLFFNEDVLVSKKKLGLNPSINYILFGNNPDDPWKNYKLAKDAAYLLNEPSIKLLVPYPLEHKKMVPYFNASSVVVLTSFAEGSPNIIKEAMACSRPIVTTDVGDVNWVIGETEGCFVSDFSLSDFTSKMIKAVEFQKRYKITKGREKIINLGLDSASVTKKIINVYEEVLVN